MTRTTDDLRSENERVSRMSADEHDAWIREKAEEGRAYLARPDAVTYSSEDVVAMLDDLRAEWKSRSEHSAERHAA